jgi:hypothetical protein
MSIVASALWRRLDTPGHDACRLEEHSTGWALHGCAVFLQAGEPANLAYSVICDRAWRTLSGSIAGAVGTQTIDFIVERQDDGAWTLNGKRADADGLDDLDLSFTPATNLLQIRRVPLAVGEPVPLPAAWFNLEDGTLSKLEQIYERRDDLALYYRAPNVGYEGLLELAPNGFIRRYPGLWEVEEAGIV